MLGGEDTSDQIPLENIVVGEEYEGVINNVVSYGAFVDIGTEVCYVGVYLVYCCRVSAVT